MTSIPSNQCHQQLHCKVRRIFQTTHLADVALTNSHAACALILGWILPVALKHVQTTRDKECAFSVQNRLKFYVACLGSIRSAVVWYLMYGFTDTWRTDTWCTDTWCTDTWCTETWSFNTLEFILAAHNFHCDLATSILPLIDFDLRYLSTLRVLIRGFKEACPERPVEFTMSQCCSGQQSTTTYELVQNKYEAGYHASKLNQCHFTMSKHQLPEAYYTHCLQTHGLQAFTQARQCRKPGMSHTRARQGKLQRRLISMITGQHIR